MGLPSTVSAFTVLTKSGFATYEVERTTVV